MRVAAAFAFAALFAAHAPAQEAGAPAEEPDGARLVMSDVRRFWSLYDRANDEAQLAELLRTEYLEKGTQALRDFVPYRILGPDSLAALVFRRREMYEAARERSLRVLELERAIRAPWYALEFLYPSAVYPDVYFLIGRFNSGGTVSPRGSLIGAEMLPDPEDVPRLVVHELVHFQQPDVPPGEPQLLAQVIREGAADFIAELASGRPPTDAYMAYGGEHEAELWAEFQEAMEGSSFSGWLYGGQPAGRPADLGYFLGYRIAEAYYRRAGDKRRAVADIISTTDYLRFLRESGYPAEP